MMQNYMMINIFWYRISLFFVSDYLKTMNKNNKITHNKTSRLVLCQMLDVHDSNGIGNPFNHSSLEPLDRTMFYTEICLTLVNARADCGRYDAAPQMYPEEQR